jgi:hypothetical protein
MELMDQTICSIEKLVFILVISTCRLLNDFFFRSFNVFNEKNLKLDSYLKTNTMETKKMKFDYKDWLKKDDYKDWLYKPKEQEETIEDYIIAENDEDTVELAHRGSLKSKVRSFKNEFKKFYLRFN